VSPFTAQEWSLVLSHVAKVLGPGAEAFANNRRAKLLAALPYLSGSEDPDRFAVSNLMTLHAAAKIPELFDHLGRWGCVPPPRHRPRGQPFRSAGCGLRSDAARPFESGRARKGRLGTCGPLQPRQIGSVGLGGSPKRTRGRPSPFLVPERGVSSRRRSFSVNPAPGRTARRASPQAPRGPHRKPALPPSGATLRPRRPGSPKP